MIGLDSLKSGFYTEKLESIESAVNDYAEFVNSGDFSSKELYNTEENTGSLLSSMMLESGMSDSEEAIFSVDKEFFDNGLLNQQKLEDFQKKVALHYALNDIKWTFFGTTDSLSTLSEKKMGDENISKSQLLPVELKRAHSKEQAGDNEKTPGTDRVYIFPDGTVSKQEKKSAKKIHYNTLSDDNSNVWHQTYDPALKIEKSDLNAGFNPAGHWESFSSQNTPETEETAEEEPVKMNVSYLYNKEKGDFILLDPENILQEGLEEEYYSASGELYGARTINKEETIDKLKTVLEKSGIEHINGLVLKDTSEETTAYYKEHFSDFIDDSTGFYENENEETIELIENFEEEITRQIVNENIHKTVSEAAKYNLDESVLIEKDDAVMEVERDINIFANESDFEQILKSPEGAEFFDLQTEEGKPELHINDINSNFKNVKEDQKQKLSNAVVHIIKNYNTVYKNFNIEKNDLLTFAARVINESSKNENKQKDDTGTSPVSQTGAVETGQSVLQPEIEKTVQTVSPEAVLETVQTGSPEAVLETVQAGSPEAVLVTEQTGSPEAVLETVQTGSPEAVLVTEQTGSPEAVLETVQTGSPEAVLETVQAGSPEAVLETVQTGSPEAVLETVQTGSPEAVLETVQTASPEAVLETVQTGSPEAVLETGQTGSPEAVLETVQTGSPEAVLETVQTGSPEEVLVTEQTVSPEAVLETVQTGSPEEVLETAQTGSPEENLETVTDDGIHKSSTSEQKDIETKNGFDFAENDSENSTIDIAESLRGEFSAIIDRRITREKKIVDLVRESSLGTIEDDFPLQFTPTPADAPPNELDEFIPQWENRLKKTPISEKNIKTLLKTVKELTIPGEKKKPFLNALQYSFENFEMIAQNSGVTPPELLNEIYNIVVNDLPSREIVNKKIVVEQGLPELIVENSKGSPVKTTEFLVDQKRKVRAPLYKSVNLLYEKDVDVFAAGIFAGTHEWLASSDVAEVKEMVKEARVPLDKGDNFTRGITDIITRHKKETGSPEQLKAELKTYIKASETGTTKAAAIKKQLPLTQDQQDSREKQFQTENAPLLPEEQTGDLKSPEEQQQNVYNSEDLLVFTAQISTEAPGWLSPSDAADISEMIRSAHIPSENGKSFTAGVINIITRHKEKAAPPADLKSELEQYIKKTGTNSRESINPKKPVDVEINPIIEKDTGKKAPSLSEKTELTVNADLFDEEQKNIFLKQHASVLSNDGLSQLLNSYLKTEQTRSHSRELPLYYNHKETVRNAGSGTYTSLMYKVVKKKDDEKKVLLTKEEQQKNGSYLPYKQVNEKSEGFDETRIESIINQVVPEQASQDLSLANPYASLLHKRANFKKNQPQAIQNHSSVPPVNQNHLLNGKEAEDRKMQKITENYIHDKQVLARSKSENTETSGSAVPAKEKSGSKDKIIVTAEELIDTVKKEIDESIF